MAINYAEKYEKQVDERFTQASLTTAAFNRNYTFDGTSTIHIYSISTAEMNDYKPTGKDRYGTPEELNDEKQTEMMKNDRSFTFTIDKKNRDDTMMTREAGRALGRQIEEIVTPEIDVYHLKVLADGAGQSGSGAITASNAYESFLDGVTAILDTKAPVRGSIAFIGTPFYKYIRLDQSFIRQGDMSQSMLVNGAVGMVENVPLVLAPAGYLPAGVDFMITNKIAATAAMKLEDYTTHDNPPGINGWLVEGRLRYDAFVLNNKKDAIYIHKNPISPARAKVS